MRERQPYRSCQVSLRPFNRPRPNPVTTLQVRADVHGKLTAFASLTAKHEQGDMTGGTTKREAIAGLVKAFIQKSIKKRFPQPSHKQAESIKSGWNKVFTGAFPDIS